MSLLISKFFQVFHFTEGIQQSFNILKTKKWQGTVWYVFNPSNVGSIDRKITVRGQPGEKQKTLSEK
jgi:hypothetical protein